MSLVYKILKELSSTTLRYKGCRVNLFGIPKFKNYSQNSLSGTLSYIKKTGLVEKSDEGLILTLKGKKYIQRKIDSLKQFYFNLPKILNRTIAYSSIFIYMSDIQHSIIIT